MSSESGPNLITNGLVLCLDAANPLSYKSGATVWNDLTYNISGGTLTNGPTYNLNNGGSIVFDGVNDWVSSTTGSSTVFTDNYSLSVWINISGYPSSGYGGIIGRFSTVNFADYNGYILAIRPNNKFSLENINTSQGGIIYSNSVINLNTWYNVIGIRENGVNKLYVNTILQTETNTQAPNTLTTIPITIGRYYSDINDFYWPGKLAIAQIYNRALSAQEVLQNYNSTKSRFGL
jgi:hypothetical protein